MCFQASSWEHEGLKDLKSIPSEGPYKSSQHSVKLREEIPLYFLPYLGEPN